MLRSANTLFDLTLGLKVWDQDSILLLTKYKNIDTLSFAKLPPPFGIYKSLPPSSCNRRTFLRRPSPVLAESTRTMNDIANTRSV